MSGRKISSLLVFALILAAWLSPTYQDLAALPKHLTLPAGDVLRLGALPGLTLEGEAVSGHALTLPRAGVTTAGVKLWGGPVVKRIHIRAVRRRQVVLGGRAIGVVMPFGAPVVVGYAPLRSEGMFLHSPAAEAGVRLGDRILKIGSVWVHGDRDVVAAVDRTARCRRGVPVRIERNGRPLDRMLDPVYDSKSGAWRIGLFVKDGMSGVGTLTFSLPEERIWAALGHPVLDAPAGALRGGRIVGADILGVNPGRRGIPGEKIGVLDNSGAILGRIRGNTPVGLVGTVVQPSPGLRVSLGTPDEVHPGAATVYTVLDGVRVRGFQVRIEKKLPVPHPTPKAFILRVTDPELLREAGGIVQGMSGSPIVQNGRLIGAVTHVFVNDPTRGFGVYATWMLDGASQAARKGGHTDRWTHPAPDGAMVAFSGRTGLRLQAAIEQPCSA